MNLGFFTMPFHPPSRSPAVTLEEDRQAIILADRNGYSEAFVGEHLTDSFENITSSLMFLASLAYETNNIKLGAGTVNLPNHHPAQLAATVAMLDHMLGGRFIFGLSAGALSTDWEIMGVLSYDKEKMFEESINQILALWSTTEPYELSGDFWNISTKKTFNQELGLGAIYAPMQTPHPEIVCTAISPYSQGLEKAAMRGWAPVSSNFMHPSGLFKNWEIYSRGAAKANIKPRIERWRVARFICVGDDDREARDYAFGSGSPYVQCIKQIYMKLFSAGKLEVLKSLSDDKASPAPSVDEVIENLVIAGDSKRVAEKIIGLREVTGPFGTLLYVGVDWQDRQFAKRSMELMANQVLDKVNTAEQE